MHVTPVRTQHETAAAENGRDCGVSLVEVLVAMIMLGIVSAIVSAAMIGGLRTTRQEQNRSDSSSAVQAQLERISRDIRVADPIRAASGSSLTLDEYRTNTCIRTTWSLNSTNLVTTAVTYATWSACSSYPTTATPTSTVTKTVLTSMANGATPVFTYQDATGTTLSASPTTNQIYVVHVTLMQSGKEGRAGVSYDTSVGVRNETLA